jgi:hypothetical protein
MSRRIVPQGAIFKDWRKGHLQIIGPPHLGGYTRELLKRFSPDQHGPPQPACQKELEAVLSAMGDDPNFEVKEDGLVQALQHCMSLIERKGPKPTTNYHLFMAARPRR